LDAVVACLLDAGADRTAQNADGRTALHLARTAATRALLLAPPSDAAAAAARANNAATTSDDLV